MRKLSTYMFALLAAVAFTSATRAEEQSPCPSQPGLYVVKAGAWQPMDPAQPKKLISGHMQFMSGSGIIAVFADGESADRLDSSRPAFCIVRENAERLSSVALLRLESRGRERRVIIAKVSGLKGRYGVHPRWFEPEATVPLKQERESAQAVRFSPEVPLHSGEYVIFMDLPDSFPHGNRFDPHLALGYDFGYFSR